MTKSATTNSDLSKLSHSLVFGLLYLILLLAASGFTMMIYFTELANNQTLWMLFNGLWSS